MHISLCMELQELHRQAYKIRNSISILLGFCHLRATANLIFFFKIWNFCQKSPEKQLLFKVFYHSSSAIYAAKGGVGVLWADVLGKM